MKLEPVDDFELNDVGKEVKEFGDIDTSIRPIYTPMYDQTPNLIIGLSQWIVILLTLISGLVFLVTGIRSKLEKNKNNEKVKKTAKKAMIVFLVFLTIFLLFPVINIISNS